MVFLLNTYRSLIKKAAAGDPQAFRTLYDRTHQKLFGYALARMNDREDAIDLLQEVYLDLWRALPAFEYRSDREFMAFVFLILKRKLVHYYQKLHPTEALQEDSATVATTDQLPDQYGLHALLPKLRREYAEVLELRYWSDLKFDEIASVLQEKTSTIKTWHHRALQELDTLLQEYA